MDGALHITHLHISYLCKYVKDKLYFAQNAYAQNIFSLIFNDFDYIGISWSFIGNGDVAIYYVRDSTNSRFFRITLMIGPGYNGSMISIEKLI